MPDDNEPTATADGSFSIRCADAVELVTDYLDDALNRADFAAFRHHLDGCEGCTIFVDQIRMTIQLTNATNDRQLHIMPADFDSLLADLRAQANDQ
ncbi:MAG: zf-HC2 domain-containing protein [Ilumatobacter sp.]|uniref:zf-HC2 domain-containing protein n=1 Tax=Ilumatobacter sp. TaxID=1967498 RepID=UPI00391BCC84